MRPTWHRLLFALFVILATLVPRSGRAQQPSQRVIAEQRAEDAALHDLVAALEPDVADFWQQANEARDAGRLEEAADVYGVVLEDHPTLDHALRRRCAVYTEMGKTSLAIGDCRSAYELAPQPNNAAALALVLAQRSALRNVEQARSLAREALVETSEDFVLAMQVAEIATAIEDQELLGDAVQRLLELDDDAWEAQVYASLHHAAAGHERRALRALERAREAGLEPELYEQLRAEIVGAVSPEWRWAKRIGFGFLVWIGLALGLIGAGIGLSRRTLAEAERAVDNPDASALASDSRLHRIYAGVMWLCCAYYYVSVPVVLLLLVVIGGGLLVGTIYAGFLSIQLIRLLRVARQRLVAGDNPSVIVREMLLAGVPALALRKIVGFASAEAASAAETTRRLNLFAVIAGLFTGTTRIAVSSERRSLDALDLALADLDAWMARYSSS